ncbi:hypothetical protein L6164_008219 [Bauhinia variegata]|uniref:Uncharacterized protein n=1 Tax=Bauhinia variegata TaxID=167791 RepID=A0ACB9PHD5_BAUVA|nr:hypothetical protein L6164_008219 [Bauhinia variegata]
MALSFSFERETSQVLSTGNSCVKEVILNRPRKLNSLNHEMANGKAFCAGGDVVSVITSSLAGHWTYPASFYKKQLILDYIIATYKKPLVFAMPEASIGLSPDVGASYFLSKLPGYFGEYVGLTGVRLDGAEMVACGLATHFVHSKKLNSLEKALQAVTNSDIAAIASVIEKFAENADVKEDSPFRRLETINKCFSRGTVEEIILSLENKRENGAEKWIIDALSFMHSSCPTSLKIFLRSIREGRQEQNIGKCLAKDYNISCHLLRRTISNDFYEGSRAKLFDKDNKPMWEPAKLELVSEDIVDQYFKTVDDEDWECMILPAGRSTILSKL